MDTRQWRGHDFPEISEGQYVKSVALFRMTKQWPNLGPEPRGQMSGQIREQHFNPRQHVNSAPR